MPVLNLRLLSRFMRGDYYTQRKWNTFKWTRADYWDNRSRRSKYTPKRCTRIEYLLSKTPASAFTMTVYQPRISAPMPTLKTIQ